MYQARKNKMDKKSVLPQERVRIPEDPNLHQHHQKTAKDGIHESFKADCNDFPSLHEISEKNKSCDKSSLECSKISYSDKLKTLPQENEPQKNFKLRKNYNSVNKPEWSSSLPNKHNARNNFETNSDVPNARSVQKACQSYRNLDDFKTDSEVPKSRNVKKTYQSLSNISNVESPVTKRDVSFEKTSIQKNFKDISDTSLPGEEASNSEGWTLCKKNTSTKKHLTHNKLSYTNISETDSNHNKRVQQASNSSYCRAEKKHNSLFKNELPFNTYSRHQFKMNLSESIDVKGAFSSDYQKPYEDCSSTARKTVPYSNGTTCSKLCNDSRSCNINAEFNSASFRSPLEKSSQPNRNRGRTSSTNVLLDSSSHQNNFRNDNKVSIQNHIKGQHSEQVSSDPVAVKNKKKRKSKVKRQTALQTGKILILTPEAHSKILNQSNVTSVKSQSNVVTNINYSEEYPELGIGMVSKSSTENPMKTCGSSLKVELPISPDKYGLKTEKSDTTLTTVQHASVNDHIEGSGTKTDGVIGTEDKLMDDTKLPIHSSDPITVSLFDMLLTGKSKKKEPEEKTVGEVLPIENSPVKVKIKKVVGVPVNPLDSTRPTIKRGKEREMPKVKKPSKMRKLILMGRKLKKEGMTSKDEKTQNSEKSDIEIDTLSDSSLSPIKSPGYDATNYPTEFCNFPKDISPPNGIIDPSQDYFLGNSCKEMLFPNKELQENILLADSSPNKTKDTTLKLCSTTAASLGPNSLCLSNDIGSCFVEPKIDETKECKMLDRFIKNNYKPKHFEEISTNLEMNILTKSLEVKQSVTHRDNNVFENSLGDLKLFENQDMTFFENTTLGVYCNTLAQSIFDACMTEIRTSHSESFVKQKVEILEKMPASLNCNATLICTEHLNDNQKKICDQNKVYTDNLMDQRLYEDKYISEESTSTSNVLPVSNFNIERNIDNNREMFESGSLRVKNFPKISTYPITNFADNSFISEEDTKLMENNAVLLSSLDHDCMSEINKEPERESSSKLYSSLEDSPKPPERQFSDKERMEATKVLLHTRRFRDYCTHFVTKELDQTVFTLLDDLARFQDRMHQKDPVKARVKRRLMYGMKEIKKHLTIKKLKGIIIATDIEDNKTKGGLNDILKEMISLSEAYHIPYVFSHKRFNLGKVCRKPAPVSCVGILNYEGSEKNFKKMLELQEASKHDYVEITKNLVKMLTDVHVGCLLETVQKSIMPYETNKTILKELFGPDPLEKESKKSESLSKPVKDSVTTEPENYATVMEPDSSGTSEISQNSKLLEDFKNSNVPESLVNNLSITPENEYLGSLDDTERTKIHIILKKYSVIKT